MYGVRLNAEEVPGHLRHLFEEVEEQCGAPWERVVEREGGSEAGRGGRPSDHRAPGQPQRGGVWSKSYFKAWQPTCSCNADTTPATVLDPFMGSGTTAVTARKLGRRSVGLELDSRCGKLIQERMGYQEVLL